MKKKIFAICLVVCLLAIAVVGGTLAYFTDTTEAVDNTFTMGKVDIELDEAKVNDDLTVGNERVKSNTYVPSMMPATRFPKDPTIHVLEGSQDSYLFLDLTFNKFSSLFWVMGADASADSAIDFDMFDDSGALLSAFKEGGVFSTTNFVTYMVQNKDVFQSMIDKWFTGIDHTKWELCNVMTDADGTYMTIRFAYKESVTAETDVVFMTHFGMPGSVTQEMLDSGTTVGGMANNFNTDKAPFKLSFTAYAIQTGEGLDDLATRYEAMFGESIGTAP